MSAAAARDPMPDHERRQHPRANVALSVLVRSGTGAPPMRAEASNISRSGVFLAMDPPPPEGTILEIEMVDAPQDAGVFQARGEVVRRVSNPALRGVGARFLSMSDALVGLIDRLVQDQMVLGNYDLQTLVATGGMGEIYRAVVREGERAGDVVAIKRMRAELSRDPAIRMLFEVERDLGARLRHPCLIRHLDADEIGGAPFLVMEYVEGVSLRHLLDVAAVMGRPIPVSTAAYIAHQVALALDAIHADQSGAVHRDPTPANIMLGVDGSVKLGDFGVAYVRADRRTRWRGTLAGTRHYLAPEQRERRRVNAATDVYVLGAVLHEMLTGQTPGHDDSALMAARLRPDAPGLGAVVGRAVAPARAGFIDGPWRRTWQRLKGAPLRYDSSATFAADLQKFMPSADEGAIEIQRLLWNYGLSRPERQDDDTPPLH